VADGHEIDARLAKLPKSPRCHAQATGGVLAVGNDQVDLLGEQDEVFLYRFDSRPELVHAWTADRLGDPTARLLGRLTLNPMAHIDWIGTVVFPLVAILSGILLLVRPTDWEHLRTVEITVPAGPTTPPAGAPRTRAHRRSPSSVRC
jgi:hypothetical protein